MSGKMDDGDAEVCWEALENVPRLPSYARRALERALDEAEVREGNG